jgi:hypothetical protein
LSTNRGVLRVRRTLESILRISHAVFLETTSSGDRDYKGEPRRKRTVSRQLTAILLRILLVFGKFPFVRWGLPAVIINSPSATKRW